MELHILASGSSGNAALVRAGGTTVLVDCGLSLRAARLAAASFGRDLAALDAVLLTHAHADHASHVVAAAAAARSPLYADSRSLARSPATSREQIARRKVEHRSFTDGQEFRVGALTIRPVLLAHDSDPTYGFRFQASDRKLGFFTDTGSTDVLESGALDGLDTLVLEFNHDRELLENGNYPAFLKARVGGPLGHLSNQQAADLVANCAPPTLERLVLAHLSKENNDPRRARAAALDGISRSAAPQAVVEIAPARAALAAV